VFLTGGGARLGGLPDAAESILKCRAQFGIAVGIEDWPENFDDPAWTTVAGLCMYAARLKMRKPVRRRAPNPFSLLGHR